jgi:hypothetical protein
MSPREPSPSYAVLVLAETLVGLPASERPEAFTELLDAITAIHQRAGRPAPSWMAAARALTGPPPNERRSSPRSRA